MHTQQKLAFTYSNEYFSVVDTLECGQVFRYKAHGDGSYTVFSQDKCARLVEKGDVVEVYTDHPDYFWHYFDLDADYGKKVQSISALSPIMMQCATFGKGIRILNQDLTEMIFSFIISANNNIKRIQLIVERICNALGKNTPFGKAFPTVEVLATAGEEFFAGVGAGYRAKYLDDTAKRLLNYDLAALKQMDTATARKELLTFLGVGPKVADCILLFGMHHGDVFPVDTWLKKVYHQHFEQGHKDAELSAFFCNLFGQDAGLCQQYLFYFQRKYCKNDADIVK